MPAGTPPTAVAPALLERHAAGLRTYLAGLQGATATRVDAVVREVMEEAVAQSEWDDDPAVWLFLRGRRRLGTGGQRGDVLVTDEPETARDEEVSPVENPEIAVHRAFSRVTNKQQEVLRLKFQFGFNLDELARITGVSRSGAGGLLHSAMAHICHGAGIRLSLGEDRRIDVRLTAYALDEMEAAEKAAFGESVPDGKALLESSDAIRRTGAQLTRVLESGAPLPKRRRRRRAGWKSPVVVGTLLVVAVGIGGAVWYFRRVTGGEEERRNPAEFSVNGDVNTPGRARRSGDDGGSARAGDRLAASGRAIRPGEAEWERKHFGQGRGGSAGDPAKEAPSSESSDTSAPATAAGGARSPGARSGPVGEGGPAAEFRGESAPPGRGVDLAGSASEARSDPDGRPQVPAESGPAAAGSRGASAASSRTAKSGGESSIQEPASEPGRGQEAGQAAQANPDFSPGLARLRQGLAAGHWPKPADVPMGEMLQQVPLEKETPETATVDPLEARVDIAPSPWNPGRHLARVRVRAKPTPPPSRPPANLVFAIDVSQSMAGANRLPLVQEGIRLLAQRLRPEDRVAVVTYAARAKEILPGNPLGEKALELRSCLATLEAGGQTNGAEGLRLAFATAGRNRVASGLNAVVLCTDGNFNLGETDERVLAAFVAQQAGQGLRLSVFGFGRSDRNDLRLELLAAEGGGRSCYVNTREEAERLLAGQVDGLLEAVANDVVVAVAFDPVQVGAVTRLDGGDTNGASAGELLPGRNLDVVFELDLVAPRRTTTLATVEASFRRPGSGTREQRLFGAGGAVTSWEQADAGFRFAAAWAEFGRILRKAPTQVDGDLERLADWVRKRLPDDAGGYRQELLESVANARAAAAETASADPDRRIVQGSSPTPGK